MRKNIISIPFSKLLKLEVQDMALEVIRILEKHDPELLQLEPMYELLLAEKPKIAALEVPHRGHPASKKLARLRKERNVHVSSIKFELRKVIALDPTGDDTTILTLRSELDRFLEDFYNSENEKVMHRKLNQFIVKVDVNAPLFDAMSSLGFISLLDNLKMNLSDVIEQLNTRSADISKRSKIKTSSIRSVVIEIIKDMFYEIRLAQLKNSELDYAPLIDELNKMLKDYNYLINVRKGVNERKAAARKAAEENASTPETTEMRTTVAGSDNDYHPSQVYAASIKKMNIPSGESSSIVSSNGSLESKDQKKAVASDWSSVQQLDEEKDTSRS